MHSVIVERSYFGIIFQITISDGCLAGIEVIALECQMAARCNVS